MPFKCKVASFNLRNSVLRLYFDGKWGNLHTYLCNRFFQSCKQLRKTSTCIAHHRRICTVNVAIATLNVDVISVHS